MSAAETDAGAGDLKLRDCLPHPALRVAEHLVERAARPAVDAHDHLGRRLPADGDWAVADVPRLPADMDAAHVRAIIDLDGRWGAELEADLERYDRRHPAGARSPQPPDPPPPWEPRRRGSTVREDKECRRFLIFPPATEPADGRARPDSQGILVFPFRTTPRPSRRVAAAAGAPAGRPICGSPAPERRGWSCPAFVNEHLPAFLDGALGG